MQKYRFSAKIFSIGTPKKILLFFREVFFAFILIGISLGLVYFALESYFESYYKNAKNTPQTVMNLPIYQESQFRSWDHFPGAKTQSQDISINSQGLRNKEVTLEKGKNRYLLLGDSFTFGLGVKQKDAFPQKLGAFLGSKYHNVINAGVVGQSIDDAYMYLKYEGAKLQPDFVVYNFFVGNDITELRRHEWIEDENKNILQVKDTLLEVDDKNRLRHKESQEPESYFVYWIEQKLSILKQKYLSEEAFDPTLTWPVFLATNHPLQDKRIEEYWLKFEEALIQMNNFCKEHNIQLIVSIIPMDVQVSKNYWKKYPSTPFNDEAFEINRPQEYMKILGKRHNIDVLDVLDFMRADDKEKRPLYFEKDPHFNKQGHRFMASYIWEFLMENYL
ncbi:hypothetical protein HON22_03500 [Candidatus Peregrinibacteria bacterium]|jgi:lysophospholipase L1-like esterase|nr:hypothetical protein [Candidatus Peregrinibacteria bacterium]